MHMEYERESTSDSKYPVSTGPDHVCTGFQLAVCTAIVGGISCSITYVVGELILEWRHVHKIHSDYKAVLDMAEKGMSGGFVINLVLYAMIVTYACNCDSRRHRPTKHGMMGWDLICEGDSVPSINPCMAILSLSALHVFNMLASGTVGYWIYTRNNKNIVNFEGSMESLCVGIVVTMLPLCISNLCLLSAYGNFQLKKPMELPVYNQPSLRTPQKSREQLEEEITLLKRENDRCRRTGPFY